ncbi:hypothetical protein [Floridanema evergladense]|uniref:Uncharacterized protein n=1 Tax=Floridaenema evergladense BLCC-F167 TaxID=3153639 RepID=A0ABV4WRK3_9CYAN
MSILAIDSYQAMKKSYLKKKKYRTIGITASAFLGRSIVQPNHRL